MGHPSAVRWYKCEWVTLNERDDPLCSFFCSVYKHTAHMKCGRTLQSISRCRRCWLCVPKTGWLFVGQASSLCCGGCQSVTLDRHWLFPQLIHANWFLSESQSVGSLRLLKKPQCTLCLTVFMSRGKRWGNQTNRFLQFRQFAYREAQILRFQSLDLSGREPPFWGYFSLFRSLSKPGYFLLGNGLNQEWITKMLQRIRVLGNVTSLYGNPRLSRSESL